MTVKADALHIDIPNFEKRLDIKDTYPHIVGHT